MRDEILAAVRALPLLAGIEADGLDGLVDEAEWSSLPAGAALFEEGERLDGFYVVLNGALGEYPAGQPPGDPPARLYSAGESIGESGAVSGSPQPSSVRALRDSELARLPAASLERLFERSPAVLRHFAREVVRGVESPGYSTRARRPACRTVAILSVDPGVSGDAFGQDLATEFGKLGRSETVRRTGDGDRTSAWFHAVERANDALVYVCDAQQPAWTRFCVRQSDVLLLVARSVVDPADGAVLAQSGLGPDPSAKAELVLLHDGSIRRGVVSRWVSRQGFRRHHHVVGGGDIARLARSLLGQDIGVVLSGGGARGFGHLGALRALRESGVEVDQVGGTSIGAVIAATVASGWSHAESLERLRRCFVDVDPVGDYTLPLVSLVSGHAVSRLLRREFGETDVTDLPLPYFCVSANLTTGAVEVHRSGPLWLWLRAAVAIPGMLPPVCFGRQMFVDGAALNNLPVDVMRRQRVGRVIAVDVGPDRAFSATRDSFQAPRPWDIGGWLALRRSHPSLTQILARAGMLNSAATASQHGAQADLLLRPSLGRIDLLDWRSFDRAIERGYRYTMEMLQRTGVPGPR